MINFDQVPCAAGAQLAPFWCHFALRPVLRNTLIIIAILCSRSLAPGQTPPDQTLAQICEQLAKCNRQHWYYTGTEMCRSRGGSGDETVLHEEDPSVQEKYLRFRATLCQGLADDKHRTAETHRMLSAEAMRYWVDYFQWLKGLAPEIRSNLLKTKSNVRAAAASLGTTALGADLPSVVWPTYETFENDWFGNQALNCWLATLIDSEKQNVVDDTIFQVWVSREKDELLHVAVLDSARIDHWREFAFRLQQLIETGAPFNQSSYKVFLRRLNELVPIETASIKAK